MFIRNVNELKQHLIETWSLVSNQQSFIDRAIDQWRDCFDVSKSKNKRFEHML